MPEFPAPRTGSHPLGAAGMISDSFVELSDGRVLFVAKRAMPDGGWVSTGAGYTHDQAKWDEVRSVRAREADIMRAYARGRGCLMMFLQQALDDPNPEPCGRCSV